MKLRTASARPTFRSNQFLKYKTREFVSSHKKDLKSFLGCSAGIPPRVVCNMAHDTWYSRSYLTEEHGMNKVDATAGVKQMPNWDCFWFKIKQTDLA